MISYRFCLLLAVGLFSSSQLSAQRTCGFDSWMESVKQNPAAYQKVLQHQKEARKYAPSNKSIPCGPGNTLVIPMAFHFNGGVTNADMTCIMNTINDQINTLNEDFGGFNTDITTYCNHASNCPADYAPTAVGNDACIQFCLATQNLPGGAADAITFGQYVWSSPTVAAPGWDGIFNVFVSDIDPPGLPMNLLGVAPISGAASPNGNGMFITASAFGGGGNTCVSGIALNNGVPYNLGRTGTHEAGHYFGLQHTFHTPVNTAPCTNGDGIADTPDQSIQNAFSPSIDYATCSSTAVNSCSTQDFFFNYMDYVNDASMYMFTADQMALMKATGDLGTWASNTITCGNMDHTPLLPVGGCTVNTPPTSSFTHDYTGQPLCPAVAEINFTDSSSNFPSSWSWTFSGAGVSPTSSTEENPTVTYNSTGTLTATLVASNTGGTGTTSTENISVQMENIANCGDCGATFVDGGGSAGNYPPQNSTYQFCTADPANVIRLDFSTIDMETWQGSISTTDHLVIYDGTSSSGIPSRYAFGQGLFQVDNGFLNGVGLFYTANSSCVTIEFNSSGNSFPGWEATVGCVAGPTCTDGIQNQGETFVDCGGPCTACPDFCNNFDFYDAGGLTGPAGGGSFEWTICANSVTDNVTVDFTTIDMQPFNNGVLQVYEGTSSSGSWEYFISDTIVGVLDPVLGVIVPFGSNTIVSTNDCFTFDFFVPSGQVGDGNGWEAVVSCPLNCSGSSEVTVIGDSGPGTLRDAINNTCDGGEITFNVSTDQVTTTLTTGELVVSQNLTITGNGIDNTFIDGNNLGRIFAVEVGIQLDIEGITLQSGSAPTDGGAFLNEGSVYLLDCRLRDNKEGGTPKAFTNKGNGIVTIGEPGTTTIEE